MEVLRSAAGLCRAAGAAASPPTLLRASTTIKAPQRKMRAGDPANLARVRREGTASARDGIFLENGLRDERPLGPAIVSVQLERKLEIRGFVAGERDRIHAGIAGGAIPRFSLVDALGQPIEAQIREAVGVEI